MSLTKTQREQTVELMAHIYKRIPWHKINTSKNAWDIWNHRVRAAATRKNLNEFVSRLANYFGMQHIPLQAMSLLQSLEPDENAVLNTIYAEHIPYAMMAVARAKEMKERDKNDDTE